MLLFVALFQFFIAMIAASGIECKGLVYGNVTEPLAVDVTNDPCVIFPEPIDVTKIEMEKDAFIYAFGQNDCADILLRRSLNPLEFDPAKVVRSAIIYCEDKSE